MSPDSDTAHASNFLRHIIERDLAEGRYATRHFAGTPGDAAHHAAGPLDAARIRTRFPPEPNGYLHIGHAKSICLNFGLAKNFGGICHLRFDDTNPDKEEQEYVDAIVDAVHWLGFDWHAPEPALAGEPTTSHLYFASDYFDFMYGAAEALVEAGKAYVDEQSIDEMRAHRGDFANAGTNSPFRARTPAENLARLRDMKAGKLADGAATLRAKIDMASPNINLRDPALYRIKRATHHNTGDRWCIYPMYTYAHPIEDALENITHSICTLEFEDQRPFYDWLLDTLCELGLLAQPRPHQYEFARLNVTYVITSKRKLKQLVDEQIVDGWDDPRLPTIAGLRRRGYTAAAIRTLCDRAGTSKAGGWTDYASLDIALRDDLDEKAPRAMAVLDPLPLKLVNWAEIFGDAAHREACTAPAHPHRPELGQRRFTLGPEVWIERDDFAEVAPKGFFRLFPGNRVRLKYGYVVECTGCEKDASGAVVAVLARVVADTRSGTPGADAVKVKGTITWVGRDDALPAEVRLYDRLFTDPHPDAGGKDFKASLNPLSKRVVRGFIEPSLASAAADQRYQFERHGYFVADRLDHTPERPVFSRIATLRDTWAK
ncbi:MAG: glutamine--tRNA ligase/YqeY domain fusion protein [Pseudomonadota bacterium]|nr:glutamine--tRNA ligase/YqeY domain fusion protein [Pseudomonadota bacterium]